MRGNVTITKRTDGRPKPWVIRWVEDDGRQRKEHRRTKVEAETRRAELIASDVRGDYVSPGAGAVTVGTFGEPWMVGRCAALKPKSAESAWSLWRRIDARWGTVRLDAIRPSQVQAWVAALGAEGLSASRTRQCIHQLGAVLDAAVRDGLIARNPARGTTLPKVRTAREHRYLTHDELDNLAAATGPHEALILLLGTTGMRWGEAAGLQVGAVDMLRRRIHVRSALSEVGGRLIEVAPKSHQARHVAVAPFVIEALAPLMEGKPRDGLVFTTDSGTPLRSPNFTRRVFAPACVRAGVRPMRVHELRHTAASLMVASGANVLDVARQLGHADPSMTLRIYAGLFEDHLDEVAARMQESRSPLHRPASPVRIVGSSDTGR